MSGDDAVRFRLRAAQCLKLAKDARNEGSRRELNNMADDLDAEADRIDQEGASTHKIVIENARLGDGEA